MTTKNEAEAFTLLLHSMGTLIGVLRAKGVLSEADVADIIAGIDNLRPVEATELTDNLLQAIQRVAAGVTVDPVTPPRDTEGPLIL